MSSDLTVRPNAAIAEQAAIVGDLSKLSPEQRMSYYGEVCKSLGLNPYTRPFQYITLNGKLTLYATRDATDQLRRAQLVSITITGRERVEDVYIVTARATTAEGRSDESTGVVSIGGLKGDNLANALMKAETKAKRRVTLSICGLGWMDESELETVRGATPTTVDYATGEIVEARDLRDQGEPRQSARSTPPPHPTRDLLPVKRMADQIRRLGGDPGQITPRMMLNMADEDFDRYVAGMQQMIADLQQGDEVPVNL
jgi:hypothetical protein